MKNAIVFLILCLVLISCKTEKKSEVEKTVDNLSNTIKAATQIDEIKEEVADLSKITPISKEDFKSWLPDEIDGLKRTKYASGNAMMANISSIEATYQNEDRTKEIKINVIDRAGEMGAASTMGLTMMFSMDFDEETNESYKRTVTKNGIKAVEEYFTKQNRTELQMLQNNDRFYVNLNAKGYNPEASWKLINQFSFKDLE
ncbi:MAG: DUF948 domain-containing protein [Flavobacteriales bacterium]|nr:DUF948 domain-containing protein [Flavobacteriia bacterium]NCP05778.1 DUF948 domain-containing protein [Flavobacteriales bacterium]PIV93619.1 MAG: hypothetical protein COW44_08665 [Flavobacteriaceae bacterium CG17_big_fil_post_rev_8_21_14_2_50_33_15]PIY13035.1 MAG: hypothetical protein COZ17_01750 [Flavobacteriaceae bacterium CG_4_10_14_3_um_filter_33_47]PJB16696.1 MAG: hypothetical protein CO117_14430 [Flavobacteriaceae bacterium CG_4_9_14_3_um_filter_33_16]